MKRIICLLFAVVLLLSGCGNSVIYDNRSTLDIAGAQNDDDDNDPIIDTKTENEFKASWLSYYELSPPQGCETKEAYETYINEIFENLQKLRIDNLFVQVRPFADAIYPSELFPSSAYVAKKQGAKLPFDFLQTIIDCAGNFGISIHAWINPYRIQTEFDADKLSENSIAKKWLDQKSENVVKAAGGLYFNPAGKDVSKLIIDGAREILKNYDVAGIHIDDYFYPCEDESIDEKQYNEYCKSGGKLCLADWRREIVSSLVSGLYAAVKSFGKDKLFTVSPCGDIEKNKNVLFADTERWCSEEGFCDMMIPQIYYGFENSAKPFEETCLKWQKQMNTSVKLCIGLALYKSGREDLFAGDGKDEWIENDDIIARQVEYIRKIGLDGFCLFSAGFVNFNKNSASKQTQNLLSVL
ncbi:MAG: glycoside hydrolase family 10 protein [Acutalibacteraceae bacterium]